MSGACSTYGGQKRCVQGFGGGDHEVRRQLVRPRHRWDDDINMDLQEVGSGHVLELSGSGYGQVAGSCEGGNEPSGYRKCTEFLH